MQSISIHTPPFLTRHEFVAACRRFASQAQRHTDLDIALHENDVCCLKVRRRLLDVLHSGHEEPLAPEEDALSDVGSDSEVLQRPLSALQKQPLVEFEIHLSPVYRVPVLYLSLLNMPKSGMSVIDQIFTYVVSPLYKVQLEETGVMGALSYTDHPLTGLPVLFVHPCRTPDALLEFSTASSLDINSYLPLWLGIVGAPFGLHLPLELARCGFANP